MNAPEYVRLCSSVASASGGAMSKAATSASALLTPLRHINYRDEWEVLSHGTGIHARVKILGRFGKPFIWMPDGITPIPAYKLLVEIVVPIALSSKDITVCLHTCESSSSPTRQSTAFHVDTNDPNDIAGFTSVVLTTIATYVKPLAAKGGYLLVPEDDDGD